jgi:hypothetical protein
MTKIDWSKAKLSKGKTDGCAEISDNDARQDQDVLAENAKKIRKRLNQRPANWLRTKEEVQAYKDSLKDKKSDG